MKFSCIKDVKSANGDYFMQGNIYEGYENEHGELYATDNNSKNFHIAINMDDEWFHEHFVIVD